VKVGGWYRRQAHRAKGQSRVGLTAQDGRGPAQGPGWRESVIQRLRHRQKRWRGRGTGVVTTTGSYEGSPADRSHLGSSRSIPVTRKVHEWSSALRNILRPVHQGQKPRTRPDGSPCEGRGGVRMEIGARQGCQRLDRISAVGRKTPTPKMTPWGIHPGVSVASRSAEAVSQRRETLDSLSHAVRSLSIRGASPLRKWRAELGTHEVWSTRSSFGWQKSVGRIARLSHREAARPVGDGGR